MGRKKPNRLTSAAMDFATVGTSVAVTSSIGAAGGKTIPINSGMLGTAVSLNFMMAALPRNKKKKRRLF